MLVLASAASAASASTAEMQDAYLVYRAEAGEANVVSIVHSDDGLITVTDTGAVVKATNGCVSKDVHVAECGHDSLPEGSDLHWNLVDLGDGNDSFEVFGMMPGEFTDYAVGGGPGDDVLLGGAEHDSLGGDAGTDRLEGGGGNDSLDGGAGADVMRGGLGTDRTTYFDRTAAVRVVIGDGPGDGEPGEGDDVQTDNVDGGSGDDVLIGNEIGNALLGGPGADVLAGRGGEDELLGQDAQVSADPSTTDRMRCGPDLDSAESWGADVVADNCEQLAHETPMRIRMVGFERPGPRRLRVTVGRTKFSGTMVADAGLSIPCGPLGQDGTRCWDRIGRARGAVTAPGGEDAVVDVVLSRRGRLWLRRHPRRRPQLTMTVRDQDNPDYPVQLRLRVRVSDP